MKPKCLIAKAHLRKKRAILGLLLKGEITRSEAMDRIKKL